MKNNENSNFLHIKNIFESISNEYDFMNDLMTFKNHSKWKEEIVEISMAYKFRLSGTVREGLKSVRGVIRIQDI